MKVRKIAVLLLLPVVLLGFFSVGFSLSHTVPILNGNLLLYLNFDEGSGSTAYDQSGNGKNGTIYNAVYSSGIYGTGLYLDGVGDYVNVPNVNITSSFTVSVWMRLNETAEWMIYSKGYVSANDFYTYNDVSTSINQKIYNNETSSKSNEFSVSLLNSWVHIVAVYEVGQPLKCYINNTATTGQTFDTFGFNDDDLHIGMFASSDAYDFKGWVDEFRVYSVALGVTDVAYLFAGEPDVTPSPSPSATPVVNGALTDTEWFVSALLLVLVVVNIVLLAFPFALVRFVFGTLSLALSAIAFTFGDVPLAPYLQIMGLVVSVVCMFLATRARE